MYLFVFVCCCVICRLRVQFGRVSPPTVFYMFVWQSRVRAARVVSSLSFPTRFWCGFLGLQSSWLCFSRRRRVVKAHHCQGQSEGTASVSGARGSFINSPLSLRPRRPRSSPLPPPLSAERISFIASLPPSLFLPVHFDSFPLFKFSSRVDAPCCVHVSVRVRVHAAPLVISLVSHIDLPPSPTPVLSPVEEEDVLSARFTFIYKEPARALAQSLPTHALRFGVHRARLAPPLPIHRTCQFEHFQTAPAPVSTRRHEEAR